MAWLKPVPSWAWYALGGALLLIGVAWWHHGKVKAHDRAVIAARDAQWQKRLDAEHAAAVSYRQKYEQDEARLTQQIKEKHDAQVRDNARLAGALSMRGPGKAAAVGCRPVDYPRVSGGSGVRPAAAGADAAAGQVPAGNGVAGMPVASSGAIHDPELALVPWGWLTQMGQEHDDLLAYVVADLDWHRRHEAAWEKMRQKRPPARVSP